MKSSHLTNGRKLTLDSLETRQLMAANVTATLSSGLLKVEGTSGNDSVIMRQIGNSVSIDGVRINGSGTINRIEVSGFGGNEPLRLDGGGVANQSVRVAATIWGGNGNDLLVGGTGNDQLVGGSGHDTLFGMIGDDRLWGEAGNDLLYGGAGNDELMGGTGNDELLGETGNDKIWGGDGFDWLWGGDGNDYVDGGADLDVAYGGRGSDTFVNTSEGGYYLVHPHFRSPVRGLGDLSTTGIFDFNAAEGDRK